MENEERRKKKKKKRKLKRITLALDPMHMPTDNPHTILTPQPPHFTLYTLRYPLCNRYTTMCTCMATNT